MTPVLRPMTLGEILDRTFQIYRSRFWLFLILAAIPALAMMALEVANQFWWKVLPWNLGRRTFLWYTPQVLLYGIVLADIRALFNTIAWVPVSRAVSAQMFEEPAGLGWVVNQCRTRWRGWIGVAASAWGLGVMVPELTIAGLLIGSIYLLFEVFKYDSNDPAQLGPKTLIVALLAGWATFQWASAATVAAVPAWTCEKLSVRATLCRALTLSRGSRMRLIFSRFVPECIGWGLNLISSQTLSVVVYLSLRQRSTYLVHGYTIILGIQILCAFFVSALVGPVYPIALTLIYYDQRIRREGLDIEWMIEAAGLNPPAMPAAAESAPAPAASSAAAAEPVIAALSADPAQPAPHSAEDAIA